MILLSKFLNEALHGDKPVRLAAPEGTMFHIDSMFYTSKVEGENLIMIFSRNLEQEFDELEGTESDMIGSFNTNFEGTSAIHQMSVGCKWITVAARTSTGFTGHLYIFGKIAKASKIDLIWEFVGKNR